MCDVPWSSFKKTNKLNLSFTYVGVVPMLELTNQPTSYLTNSAALEPAGSSLYLQEPVTGSDPEPTVSTLHPPSQSP
jgi:hypothetical protein